MHAALATLTRMYPLLSGYGTLANSRFMRQIAPPSSEQYWARSPGGYVQVSLNEFVGRTVYFFGDLDPKITWILKRLIEPGDQVLDIGANIGIVTLWMSKLVGPQGIVHAFEPNPTLQEQLRKTLSFNKVSNVTLHPIGLGDADRAMELHIPHGNNCGAGSFTIPAERAARSYVAQIKRLDSICLSKSEIAAIKLDVEGFEFEVLKGATRILSEIRPRAIIFEANGIAEREPIVRLLRQYNYESFAIPRCLFRMKIKPLGGHAHDLIAIRSPAGVSAQKLRVSS